MGKREENRRATSQALAYSAIALFEERGADATMEEIAERAGVSRRTAFRHVDSKEDLIFHQPYVWLEMFDQALESEAFIGLTLIEALHGAGAMVAEHVDDHPDLPRRSFALALSDPRLNRGYPAMSRRWVERVSQEVWRREPDDMFRSQVVAHAFMGMIDAALAEWMMTGGLFTDIFERGFTLLLPLLVRSPQTSDTAPPTPLP